MSAITGVSQSTVSGVETPSGQPQSLPAEELPKASEDALDFIESIDEDDFKNLLFEDNLVTVSDTGKELGDFRVTVSTAKFQGQDTLLIHANSHGAIDSVPCGTSITAYVSPKLETLEQQHHEYVKLENHPLDRKTFIVRQKDEYVVSRVITQGEDVQRTAQTFSAENLAGFVSEGSNLLLQRLLVKKGIPDNFQMTSFDSDTNLCPVMYRGLEKRTQIVDKMEIDVYGVERTINSHSDLPTSWQSYFTSHGHLTSRVQVGSPVTMRLLVLPPPVEEDEEEEKPVFEKRELNWEQDMQLYSKFLDRKEELKADHAVYMKNHPELKSILSDFLQFLLLRKPSDVVAFAAEYFASFSSKMPVPFPYSQSAVPTPFPQSRSNSKIQYLSKSTSDGL